MKSSVNLLPLEPEEVKRKKKDRQIRKLSVLILISFCVLTLVIFGINWLLLKDTGDSLKEITRQEELIKSLAPKENLYRRYFAKVVFLSSLWQKKVRPEAAIEFIQSLPVDEVTVLGMSFKDDGTGSVSLAASSSAALENFVDKITEIAKTGSMRNVEISSFNKSEKTNFNFKFNLSFKFKGVL